jgi:ribosomal protein S3AE
MWSIKWFVVSVPIYFGSKQMGNYLIDDEAKMSFRQRCKMVGLEAERHYITTDDGYILQLFRIVNDKQDDTKSPVYFQHGSQSSAMCWVANKHKSSPFVLAKNGYDVWVSNARG